MVTSMSENYPEQQHIASSPLSVLITSKIEEYEYGSLDFQDHINVLIFSLSLSSAQETNTIFCNNSKTMTHSSTVIRLLIVALAATAWYSAEAKKDYNKPHGHGSILSPYTPGPFKDLSLNKSDEKKLAEGKSVMKQSMPDPNDENPAGGAICVQDIMAPRDAVWSQILDLDNYKKKVSKVLESKNYKVNEEKNGIFNIKTKMVMGVMPGYKVRCQKKEGILAHQLPCQSPYLAYSMFENNF